MKYTSLLLITLLLATPALAQDLQTQSETGAASQIRPADAPRTRALDQSAPKLRDTDPGNSRQDFGPSRPDRQNARLETRIETRTSSKAQNRQEVQMNLDVDLESERRAARDTNTTDRVERREESQQQRAERRAEFLARRAEQRAKRQANVEARFDVQTEKRAERRDRFSERIQVQVNKKVARMNDRYDQSVQKAEDIYTRIESRLIKLADEGVDTSRATSLLASAKVAIEAAGTATVEAEAVSTIILEANNPGDAWQEAKSTYASSKTQLQEAKSLMRQALEAAKVAVAEHQAATNIQAEARGDNQVNTQ